MRLLLSTMIFSMPFILGAQTVLFNSGTSWKLYDLGQAPANWNQPDFDDSGWSQGNAELGYGDGDETTVVGFGPSSSNKFMTTYFRKSFTINDPSIYASLLGEMVRDDGAVVYLNGVEVWRSNMPGGTVGFNTPAAGTVAWPSEDDWHTSSFSAAFLQPGNNVIAVEIHQDEPSSSDISFNFKLSANSSLNASVVRGPYLQKATQTSIILRWRTDIPTDTRVRYGISPAALNNTVVSPQFTTEHTVQLTGLQANSQYFYSIGTNNTALMTGSNLYFETLPPSGDEAIYRFLVLGDAGTGYQEQIEARNASIQYNGGPHFDGVILLGDNAYQSGFDTEYQSNFFDNKYNQIFENTVIWPAPGNHDYNNHIPFSPDPAYFDIFDCPTNGECGGIPSGTEKYYSVDYGNVHLISLDSYDVPRSVTGEMAQWLQQDLAANQLPWIVVYFHHPPYTKGSHDSDNTFFLDGELVDMRENIMPILENFGVDLILSGHSHSYERSYLIDGHYDDSDTFGPQNLKDGGSGNYPADCFYLKETGSGIAHQGAVYSVVGCSGKLSSVQSDWPHPAMYSYTNEHVGTMMFSVEKNRLDAVFLTKDGNEFDKFTIVKNAGEQQTIYVCPNDPVHLEASWPGSVVWSPGGQTGQVFTINALSNATVTASDPLGCVEDVFEIVVVQNDTCVPLTVYENGQLELPSIRIIEQKLEIDYKSDLNIQLYSNSGVLVREFRMKKPKHKEDLSDLSTGIYYLRSSEINFIFKVYLHD